MEIKILPLVEGAKQAIGLTVIIDVFRAFSTACYAFANGADKIIPIGIIDMAYRLKQENPDFILMGERGGRMQPGFDYGNSPTKIEHVNFNNKSIIQTTSAGTQGIANAINAQEIITGSFVNAQAIVDYIQNKNPDDVSLVCMGEAGVRRTNEDTQCAEFLKSSLNSYKTNFDEIEEEIRAGASAKKFFDPTIDWAPERDFELCMSLNRFDFILKVFDYEKGLVCLRKLNPDMQE